MRRSLSEDDRRKLDRKDGSGSKKRKHDFDRRKKSSSPGFCNFVVVVLYC